MEWNDTKIATLIELYRDRPCLWDAKNEFHKVKPKKIDAWRNIASIMKCDPGEIDRKMKVLLSQFRREKLKIERKIKSGANTEEVHKWTWIHFKSLRFLYDKPQPRSTKNTYTHEKSYALGGKNRNSALDIFIKKRDDIDEDIYVNERNSNQDTRSLDETIEKNDSVDTDEKIFRLPKKASRKRTKKENPRTQDAYKIITSLAEKYKNDKDECSAFGEYITNKLRKYDERTRAIAQYRISNIIFEMDLGTAPQYPTNNYVESVNLRNDSSSTCSTPLPSPTDTGASNSINTL